MNNLLLRHHAARHALFVQPISLIRQQYRFTSSRPIIDLTTTRPAPLNLPEPPHPHAWPSTQSLNPTKWDFVYLFNLGRAYGKFFWTGVKNVNANRKSSNTIKRHLTSSTDSAARSHALSYAEYELTLRTTRDLKKLIPFSLIFLICGEFTPLIILAAGSSIVPATCVIPKQVAQEQAKMQQREQRYMLHIAENWDRYSTQSPGQDIITPDFYRLGLSASFEPYLYSLRASRFQSKLKKQCIEVLNTASLVANEGGWKTKSPQDMWEWGCKYGMYSLRKYADTAIGRGEEPVSEEMKQKMLPVFEKETELMLKYAEKCGEEDTWKAGYHSWASHPERPDCAAQRHDLEQLTQTNTQKIASSEVLRQGDAAKKPH